MMEIPLVKKPDGTMVLMVPDETVETVRSLSATLKESLAPVEEAALAEATAKDNELARLRDIEMRFIEQVTTPEGFAELAEATKLLESDEAFIRFAETVGKGHLVGTAPVEEPPEAAVEEKTSGPEPEPAPDKKADELAAEALKETAAK